MPLNNKTFYKPVDPQLKNTIRSVVPPSSVAGQEDRSFPKKEKLKSRKLIDRLFVEGKSVSKYPIKFIYLKIELPNDAVIKAGVAVSKRNFKSAVKRNRIKRLLREAYRLNKSTLFNNHEASFAFLFLYLGKEMPKFVDIERAMSGVLDQFLEKKKIP